MFGFLAALLATGVVAAVLIARGGRAAIAAPAPAADLPNGAMVERFDSYLYRTRRALPAPAQAQIDAMSAALPSLRETLDRVDALDPDAQDARRLMSIHLPGLIDRYLRVPRRFAASRTAKARPSTIAWSKRSAPAAPRCVRSPRSSLAPTWPRSKPRAASSSRATATMARTWPRRRGAKPRHDRRLRRASRWRGKALKIARKARRPS